MACAVQARPEPFPDADPVPLNPNDSLKLSDVDDTAKKNPFADMYYNSEEKLKREAEWEEENDESINSIRALHDPKLQNTPHFDEPFNIKLPPSKLFLVAETLLNISTNSCPHIDKSYLQSFNKFLLTMIMMRLKFQKVEHFTKLGHYYFEVNYSYMKKCENHTRFNKFPKKIKEPDYEEYSLEVEVDDDNNTFVKEDGKLKRVKRHATHFVINIYLDFLYDIMKKACAYVALPDKSFIENFITQTSEQAVAFSNQEHIFSALQKQLAKSAPIMNQFDVCFEDTRNRLLMVNGHNINTDL
ncbi:unnamed protein product [Orchesella dallaii]|uniref:Uncharacterized protein n=1 Tax=Orchesella dallaii TaxID=48710 RepID=A0ABP1PKR3_9HEXA